MQNTDHKSVSDEELMYITDVAAQLDIDKLRTIRFALEEYSASLYKEAKKNVKVVSKNHTHHEDLHFQYTTLGKIHGLLFEIHYLMEKHGVDA